MSGYTVTPLILSSSNWDLILVLYCMVAQSQECLFLTFFCAEISVRCTGYNFLASPARFESDVECKWNVKCAY